MFFYGCRDSKYDDNQPNDTQHNDAQTINIKHNDTLCPLTLSLLISCCDISLEY